VKHVQLSIGGITRQFQLDFKIFKSGLVLKSGLMELLDNPQPTFKEKSTLVKYGSIAHAYLCVIFTQTYKITTLYQGNEIS